MLLVTSQVTFYILNHYITFLISHIIGLQQSLSEKQNITQLSD